MRQKRIDAFLDIDLYPVTCESLSAGRSNVEVLEGLIAGGARVVQLRDKEASPGDLYKTAVTFREMTTKAGMLLIVNDYVDIALAVGVDGVHLGQDDMPPEAVRSIAPDLLVGISTHSLEQALTAQAAGADYINIGPIYPTGTKKVAVKVMGPKAVTDIGSQVQIPFTVMGGIKESNMDQVLKRGARRLAVVTAVTQAPDIAEAVRKMRERILGWHEKS
ncbi:MAG: thiamine phosphate synthase [bacterium]|nr:thiamine phosphate synthase [bacterium]MDT8366766.1 thiamine phosphate synthase [bacterium]